MTDTKERITIVLLDDNKNDIELFKIRLKMSGLVEKMGGIDLITATTPKDAIQSMHGKKIDLVISDIRNEYASEEEMERFLRVVHKKTKLMFLSSASWDLAPKLDGVELVPKININSKNHQKDIFNKIESLILSDKKQNIPETEFGVLTRPQYHVATPNDKEISKMVGNLSGEDKTEYNKVSTILELNQLKKDLKSAKSNNLPDEQFNLLWEQYQSVLKRLNELKKKEPLIYKAKAPKRQKYNLRPPKRL